MDLVSNDEQRTEFAPLWVFYTIPLIFEVPVATSLVVYLSGWQTVMGVFFFFFSLLILNSVILCYYASGLQPWQTNVSSYWGRFWNPHAWEDEYSDRIKTTRRLAEWKKPLESLEWQPCWLCRIMPRRNWARAGMLEWNSIFRLFRFSGILGQRREVHPKFRNEIPVSFLSIRSPTRKFRNFWSNGKRPSNATCCTAAIFTSTTRLT